MLIQCMLAAVFATGFAADDNATLIIGTWSGSMVDNGVTINIKITFTKDGQAKAVVEADKKDFTIEGTYKVEKDKLILKRNVNGKDDDDNNTIKELTKDKLIIIDDKNKKEISLTRKKDTK